MYRFTRHKASAKTSWNEFLRRHRARTHLSTTQFSNTIWEDRRHRRTSNVTTIHVPTLVCSKCGWIRQARGHDYYLCSQLFGFERNLPGGFDDLWNARIRRHRFRLESDSKSNLHVCVEYMHVGEGLVFYRSTARVVATANWHTYKVHYFIVRRC